MQKTTTGASFSFQRNPCWPSSHSSSLASPGMANPRMLRARGLARVGSEATTPSRDGPVCTSQFGRSQRFPKTAPFAKRKTRSIHRLVPVGGFFSLTSHIAKANKGLNVSEKKKKKTESPGKNRLKKPPKIAKIPKSHAFADPSPRQVWSGAAPAPTRWLAWLLPQEPFGENFGGSVFGYWNRKSW